MAEQPPEDAVFSLTCAECDAGQEIPSQAEAEAAGWTEICYAPDLPMANFLGLCPECRRWLEEQDRS